MTDQRKLDFDAIGAMVFTDKAAEIAANPRFSGEGHPVVAENDLSLTLIYSHRQGGVDHSRIVCLSYDPATDKYSLVLEQDTSPPPLAVPKAPKVLSRRPDGRPTRAESLPSGCEKAVSRGVEAHRKSMSGERVAIALEVGSTMTVNGANKATITAVERATNPRGRTTGWKVITDAGLTFEFDNGATAII